MTLIALAVGLLLEHLATALLHLRQLRWFDGYYDLALRTVSGWPKLALYPALLAVIAVPALPVLLLSLSLREPGAVLWDLAYLSFAVLIVFFCLGPRDLGSEVDDYCDAMDRGDEEAADRILIDMSETQHSRKSDIEIVEDAIFVQSNNRAFGVMFWFVVLGPVGAWVFRVSDLFRRRIAFEHQRSGELENVLVAIEAIYGLFKWIPARLAMLGYALAGSFDDAMNAWRGQVDHDKLPIDEFNDRLIARVGRAAMTGYLDEPANSSAAARNSMLIVRRTIFFWVTAIALLTLFGVLD